MRVIQEIISPPREIYDIDSPIVNQGTTQIADVPVNYPMPTYTPNTQVGGVKTNLLDLEIEPINTPITSPTTTASTTTASTTTSTSPSTNTSSLGTGNSVVSNTGVITNGKKKPNYVLYGGILLAVIIAYKLLSSNKEN